MSDFVFQGQQSISFHEYMHQALYNPVRGYYSQRIARQDPEGDYITAPTLSRLFARCVSHSVAPLLRLNPDWSLAEYGPGLGHFAVDLLTALDDSQSLPCSYHCIEPRSVSRSLQETQIQNLPGSLPDLFRWQDMLPSGFCGVVLANEVLDALPVHLLQSDEGGQINSLNVCVQDGQLVWDLVAPHSGAYQAFSERGIASYPNYRYEISLSIPLFIESLSQCMTSGLCFFFDYGYPRGQYYHPQRNMGTLSCFYKHHLSHDPLLRPGLQDISCHVDFTLLAHSAKKYGFSVLGYTTQEKFLLANHIGKELLESRDCLSAAEYAQYRKTADILTSPSEMGETVKVMCLAKNVDPKIVANGFQFS